MNEAQMLLDAIISGVATTIVNGGPIVAITSLLIAILPPKIDNERFDKGYQLLRKMLGAISLNVRNAKK